MDFKELREKIDEADTKLTAAFEERLEAVREIGEIKKKDKSPIYDAKRESEIIERLSDMVKDENKAAVEELYRAIFAISKELEK